MKLASIDLFTGLGGFVLALSGVCEPVLYCDKDPHVLKTIDSLMAKKVLPHCPVVHDVKDVKAMKEALGRKTVDMVTAGFPCVGFSSIGANEGLENDASALFFDVLKVVKAFKPKMIMLENVAPITSTTHRDGLCVIVSELVKLGFDMRWTTCSAASVGAPHTRSRWFCLCTKKKTLMPTVQVQFSDKMVVDWSGRAEPPLMGARVPDYRYRSSMLGNSIVPAAACLAFYRLFSSFRILSISDLIRERGGSLTFDARATPSQAAPTLAHGIIDCGEFIPYEVPQHKPASNNIIVDPTHYKDGYLSAQRDTFTRNGVSQKSPLVRERIYREMWPTVRANAHGTGHVLTVRMANDLHTAARFASSVRGVKQKRTDSTQWLNVNWIEWLMGYPVDYTRSL
jgi:DNA-cytosine methyltransferase